MNLRITILTLLILGNAAITRAESTPEEVVVTYFASFKESDMKNLASNMHPDELTKFRKMMLPVMVKGISMTTNVDESEDAMAMQVFTGDDSIGNISNESPEAFFTRFMKWVMTINPDMKSSMESAKIEPVGHVMEGDLAHVVYRMKVEMLGTFVTQISAITLKKNGDEWKLMLTGEIEGMSKLLEANINQM